MTITLSNPQTGEKHVMDKAAMYELRTGLERAQEAEREQVVFRAMRIDVDTVLQILAAEG